MTNNKNTREIGAKAESRACKYLESIGYKIIKRNFHYGKVGEIDIVAKDKDILVFVEVKCLTKNSYGDPLDSITPKKQTQIRRVAEGYYYINKIEDQESRYDIITVDYRKQPEELDHIIEAFY